MNMNSKSGSGSASAFFVILFLASIALNVAFLTGCISTDKSFGRSGKTSPALPIPPSGTSSGANSEAEHCLRNIANLLGLYPSREATPGDIEFNITQALKYEGDVFSPEVFQKYRKGFLTDKDVKTFEAYHSFVKKFQHK